MDQEFYRLVLAIVLTGLVIFAWQYYRGIFWGQSTGTVKNTQHIEISEMEKTASRKDLSNYENCGSLKIVVYPIYKALEFLNDKTKNLGIALILLTLAIRALLAPLMIKQIHGLKKMALLQNEVQEIREKHVDNPLEMQKALGDLYKEHGVHPLLSLGPILIQIPLFVALYKIVGEAHIFSGASLGLWIQDLSVADPYFVLPLMAGFLLFLGTKLSGGADTQMPKCLTYVFPVLFTGFLLRQPAGLALYILVGSFFQLGVSFGLYKFSGKKT